MSGLLEHAGDGGYEPCVYCGGNAAGPCARCRRLVCGACSVLTTGGSQVWAICVGCDARDGRSLRRAWLSVVGWFMLPIVVLVGVIALLGVLF